MSEMSAEMLHCGGGSTMESSSDEVVDPSASDVSISSYDESNADEVTEVSCFSSWCQQSLFLSEEEFVNREEAAALLKEDIEKALPEVTVEVYGSLLIGCMLRASRVNVFVSAAKHRGNEALFSPVYDVLSAHERYSDLELHVESKCVTLSFKDSTRNVNFCMAEKRISHFRCNKFIKLYLEMDDRAMELMELVRGWAHICELDQQERGSLPVVAYYVMVIHFLQQQQPPVLPCIHELVCDNSDVYGLNKEEMNAAYDMEWRSDNTETADELLAKFFKFYLDAKISRSLYTASLRSSKLITLGGKKWPRHCLSIEDPLSRESNFGASMKARNVLDYFQSCLKFSDEYFLPKKDMHELNHVIGLENDERRKFYRMSFAHRNSAVYHCFNCNSSGHWIKTCPQMQVATPNYNPPGLEHLLLLEQVLMTLVEDLKLSANDARKRLEVVQEIEDFIKQQFKDASLHLFGSSVNGFGFMISDLDICMLSHGPDEPEDLDKGKVIKLVAKHLRVSRLRLHNILTIASAKVPIVRFELGKDQQEVDISLYNCLAIRNSKLLQRYSDIDPRVQTLGFTVKLFAKMAKIGDASQGSLSSYAYILMVIHFLQQTSPPILPVLQQLPAGVESKEVIVEGCNTWFFDGNQEKLRAEWPEGFTNNKKSSELWLEFLYYYASVFNWNKNVVCIRQKEPLLKLKKCWLQSVMAIEDPFNHRHNLGKGIKKDMHSHILAALAHSLEHFSLERAPQMFPSIGDRQAYFFDPSKLVGIARLPSKRCFQCGRTGHFASECNISKAAQREKRQQKKKTGDSKTDAPPRHEHLTTNVSKVTNIATGNERARGAVADSHMNHAQLRRFHHPVNNGAINSNKGERQGPHSADRRVPPPQYTHALSANQPGSLPHSIAFAPPQASPFSFGMPIQVPYMPSMSPPSGPQMPAIGLQNQAGHAHNLGEVPQPATIRVDGEQLLQQWIQQMHLNQQAKPP